LSLRSGHGFSLDHARATLRPPGWQLRKGLSSFLHPFCRNRRQSLTEPKQAFNNRALKRKATVSIDYTTVTINVCSKSVMIQNSIFPFHQFSSRPLFTERDWLFLFGQTRERVFSVHFWLRFAALWLTVVLIGFVEGYVLLSFSLAAFLAVVFSYHVCRLAAGAKVVAINLLWVMSSA
jgi:hypothetical protein